MHNLHHARACAYVERRGEEEGKHYCLRALGNDRPGSGGEGEGGAIPLRGISEGFLGKSCIASQGCMVTTWGNLTVVGGIRVPLIVTIYVE